jgi:hypothetical protein
LGEALQEDNSGFSYMAIKLHKGSFKYLFIVVQEGFEPQRHNGTERHGERFATKTRRESGVGSREEEPQRHGDTERHGKGSL